MAAELSPPKKPATTTKCAPGAQATTAQAVRALSACMWLFALAAIARQRRTLGRVAIPALLAFSTEPLAHLRTLDVAVIAILTVVVLPISWQFMNEYQKGRIVSFMDPERDPQGKGYQLIQSQIAVGSGGMFGKGVTKGTQTQLRFLPVPHKDFIFSAFAEEHGFVGVTILLSMFFVLVMRIVQNAHTAPDRVGMYLCMGVAALLLFHILINVGMVAGLMPVTGIPLPFMSFGGSSIWTFFLALGLVNNVRLRRFVN